MKKFIVRLVVVIVLALTLLLPTVGGRAQALIACPPTPTGLHLPCAGGGVICVDRHGHVHRWHGRIHPGWHCVAI